MTNKKTYFSLCSQESAIPLFSRPWWLDATVGPTGWDVALAVKGNEVAASLPYTLKRRLGHTVLGQPPLTQFLGPWFRKTEGKYANRLATEKDLSELLITNLPTFSHYQQNWSHLQRNWLPFYWKGFKQTTRYTYAIPDLSDLSLVWQGFLENIRTDIRKAKDRLKITVRTDLDIDDFLRLNRQVFERQGIRLPYSEEFVRRLDQACTERNARRIFVAEDPQGRRHAAVYIVWDQHSAYYLMGGGDPELRNSGATSLCMWEAINFASTVTRRFDFEGSMIESVERFFRAFGATQTPYFSVSKTPSRLIRTARFLRDLRAGA